jgi:hypothetical protein
MICTKCYMESMGAKMEDAIAVAGGETVCSEHLQDRAQGAEAIGEASPDVTPH